MSLETVEPVGEGTVAWCVEGFWSVAGCPGEVDELAFRWMQDLRASDRAVSTTRSYSFDLLRWVRFLTRAGVAWSDGELGHVRDFVLWLRDEENPQRSRTPGGRPEAGSVNEKTGKRYLELGYAAGTINHNLTVVGSFYDFAWECGRGPGINPVPANRARARWGVTGWASRGRYRQKVTQGQPRHLTEDLLKELFAVLRHDRDRAMVAVTLSSGVRAGELLSMQREGVDTGLGVLSIVGKGSGGQRTWVPAAPESFVWIARYLEGTPPPAGPLTPLWLSLRAPFEPLSYPGLRMVLERANAKMGTNVTWHDLRHTFTHRLLEDESMALTDVQALLRHRNLNTLSTYSSTRLDALVSKLLTHLSRPPAPPPTAAVGYDAADLAILFPNFPGFTSSAESSDVTDVSDLPEFPA